MTLLLVVLQACAGNDPGSGLDKACSERAEKAQLDDVCAIEIAKEEILKRQGKMNYSRFSVRFDSIDDLWVVMAIHEPVVPGGHVYVEIRRDGTVHGYALGE